MPPFCNNHSFCLEILLTNQEVSIVEPEPDPDN